VIDARHLAPPGLSLRWTTVWRRNYLVWQRLAIPSILGNLADPLIMLFGLGYGIGAMIGGGANYFAFLAAGFVASSSMYAASFEALYSAFSRMHVQRTWEAIVYAPLSMDDVLAGEYAWAATKALSAGACMLLVVALFGYARSPQALLALPVVLLIGLAFSGLGLAVQAVAQALPLYHGVALVRPLMSGEFAPAWGQHLAVLAAYAIVGFYVATVLTRRRLLK